MFQKITVLLDFNQTNEAKCSNKNLKTKTYLLQYIIQGKKEALLCNWGFHQDIKLKRFLEMTNLFKTICETNKNIKSAFLHNGQWHKGQL